MIKIIRCPSCGEDIVLEDVYEGMEIVCKLCNCTLVYINGKLHVMETNEEYDLEELAMVEEEEEKEKDEFTEEYEEYEEYYYDEYDEY